MDLQAILFDTRSIQRYIFSGNKLKTNIGASYLVDRVFDDVLLPILNAQEGIEVDVDSWREDASENYSLADMPDARVAYIGGGNALVLFRSEVEESVLQSVVAAFTKQLLVDYPGLKTGAAIGVISLAEDGTFSVKDGRNDLTRLVHQLKAYQSSVFPNVNLPYTGLTLSCEVNGEAANAYDDDLRRLFSWEVEKKLSAVKPAEKELREKLDGIWNPEGKTDVMDGFAFPMDLSSLGQRETEDYVAIVHIDGNNMGQKFANCNTLTDRKNMSIAIREKTIRAFCRLTESILAEQEAYFFLKRNRSREGDICLPIRPLVLGGDDMTFVCAAKLAFRYTERVMKAMEADGIDTCAGIAIMKSSYPFFRGYTLAEQLCDAAKGKMRALMEKAGNGKGSCWMDFAILHGEQAPTLEQIREQAYRSVDGENMHFGPYQIGGNEAAIRNWENMKKAVYEIRYGEHRMPMGKIKEMRNVIPRSKHERMKFIAQLRHLAGEGDKMRLPLVKVWEGFEETLWKDGATPYVDVIELIDYYIPEEVKGDA